MVNSRLRTQELESQQKYTLGSRVRKALASTNLKLSNVKTRRVYQRVTPRYIGKSHTFGMVAVMERRLRAIAPSCIARMRNGAPPHPLRRYDSSGRPCERCRQVARRTLRCGLPSPPGYQRTWLPIRL